MPLALHVPPLAHTHSAVNKTKKRHSVQCMYVKDTECEIRIRTIVLLRLAHGLLTNRVKLIFSSSRGHKQIHLNYLIHIVKIWVLTHNYGLR